MLKSIKVCNSILFTRLCRYNPGELVIGKNINTDTNHFYVNSYDKQNNSFTYLMSLSVEELRYCCGLSPAILQAVWDYYDNEDTTIDDISFIGISKEKNIDELMSDFNSSCNLAMCDASDINDTIEAIRKQMDLLNAELSIMEQAHYLYLLNKHGGN